MRSVTHLIVFFIIIFIVISNNLAQEFNEIMMKCTYYIEGNNADGDTVFGSCFIIGKPMINDSNRAYYIMVTAKHIFDDITKDEVSLLIRKKISDSIYIPILYKFNIRINGKNLYFTHPDTSIDLVAMYLPLPNNIDIELLPSDFLADDEFLKDFGIHPGDNVFCVGFPHGLKSNVYGFPILSDGALASYPILPTKFYKKMLININTFSGNSGGPVYVYEKEFLRKNVLSAKVYKKIIGLISNQFYVERKREKGIEIFIEKIYMKIVEIVPSTYIKELIDMIPYP